MLQRRTLCRLQTRWSAPAPLSCQPLPAPQPVPCPVHDNPMRASIRRAPHQGLVYVHASIHCNAAPKVVSKGLLSVTSRRVIAKQLREFLQRTSHGQVCFLAASSCARE